ncbi:MAG: electron transfer flavoprotein subunit alpha/FixB family protein, partial [Flavobacteriia bacterium]|nr:electron transfer flavoprotein subunit alpha/FixB family protein [Flavobacteriia bacterium]
MVLIFAETWNGQFKKSTFEAVRYGAECAKAQGSQAIAVVVGAC